MTSEALALVSCSATLASITVEAFCQETHKPTEECEASETFGRGIIALPMRCEITRLGQINLPAAKPRRDEVGSVPNLSEAQQRTRRERDAQPAEPSCD